MRVAGPQGLRHARDDAVGDLSRSRARARARCSRAFETDIAIDWRSLPHMSLREGRFAGVPARLYRVSFSGELGYEINVPARYGAALWRSC